MSLSANVNEKAGLIWAIADKLTGVYKPHEYGEVILPLTVIRRFDCILAEKKDAVLAKYEQVKNLPMKDILLRNTSGFAFYNVSKYTFERLLDDPDHIEENFRDYLNGFSEAHNEDAGQHYIPREVIQLMVNILFYDDNDVLSGNNVVKTIYESKTQNLIQINDCPLRGVA